MSNATKPPGRVPILSILVAFIFGSKEFRRLALDVALTEVPTWARRGPYRWLCRRLMDRWHKEHCWQMAQVGRCDHLNRN